MKKSLLVILILFASQLNILYSEANNTNKYQVISKHLQRICNNQKAVFFITYPQIKNYINKKSEKSINKLLDNGFSSYKNGKCSYYSNDESYKEDISYEVKLKTESLLSIKLSSTGYMEGAAHPNNLLLGYTFDLKHGKIINLKDIFNKKINYKEKIKPLIQKSLVMHNYPADFPEKDNYDFYLTPKGIVIVNLFDFFAGQNIEADIKYSDIKDLLNKDLNLKLK